MSLYRIHWPDEIDDELAEIWIASNDRPAVTRAQQSIEILLGRDPLTNSEHLREGLRKIVVEPLTVIFTVDEDNKQVEVCQVKPCP